MKTLPHQTTKTQAKIQVVMRAPQFCMSARYSVRRDILEAAAAHFANALHLDGSVKIRIEAYTSKVRKGTLGHCADKNEKGVYTIRALRDLPILDLIETLAHEMIHVAQFSRGDLKRADGDLHWRGAPQMGLAWAERGHEQNAMLWQGFLAEDFWACNKAAKRARHYA